jgi:hypothetical protein
MFTGFFNFLLGLWNATKTICQTLWTYVLNGWAWFVGLIAALLVIVTSAVHFVHEAVLNIITSLTAMVLPSANANISVGDWLTVANTIFPLSEGFVILVALSQLWVLAGLYRFYKSWIPTVN